MKSIVHALVLSVAVVVFLSRFCYHSFPPRDLRTFSCLKTLSGHGMDIFCSNLSADGQQLYSGCDSPLRGRLHGMNVCMCVLCMRRSGDKTVKCWNLSKPDFPLSYTLDAHTSDVYAVAVLRDGSLATASVDKTLKIWD